MKIKKSLRIAGYVLLALLFILFSGIGYLCFFLPGVPVPDLKVDVTPARVERGKYLANHVTVCVDCHSVRDWTKFSGPLNPGTEGKGGESFGHAMGLPGDFFATNITPYTLSKWSDGEIYRAIVNGVGKGNRPLFPIMPYQYYRHLGSEDVYSIIAYLRTLPSISSDPPASKADFPVNIIMHTFAETAAPSAIPPKSDSAGYGRYLVSVAACKDCHTPFVNNQLDEKMSFAGGREFKMPSGVLYSDNITPDPETGIGRWTKMEFVKRFKSYDLATYLPAGLSQGEMMTVKPWTMFAGMDTTDLECVYTYLKTLKPLKNSHPQWIPSAK